MAKKVSLTNPVFLSELDIEKRWGGFVRSDTLRVWRSRGIGPVYTKLGNVVVYHIDDIVAYEKKHKIIPRKGCQNA
ncbi:MAG TPA: hypothetical protein VHO70_15920 [Chitinispirillaceae bacterium]|nr:hypothetical protein [Chitinispirillaceae bacterium]